MDLLAASSEVSANYFFLCASRGEVLTRHNAPGRPKTASGGIKTIS
jgi:hypothetical protein